MSSPKVKSHKKKDYGHYDVYIYKVLKQVHPDTGISGEAMSAMDEIVHHSIRKIMHRANLVREGKATITSREIQTAVRLSVPGELTKHAVGEATKALAKFRTHTHKKGDAKHSKQSLAGLQFSVSRVEREMRKCAAGCKCRLSAEAPIYLAAVVEYLVAEILELSGNASRDNKRVRITTRHIFLAIGHDEDLAKFYGDCIITAGVIPHIHEALLRQKAAPKKKAVPKPKASSKKKVGAKSKAKAAPKK